MARSHCFAPLNYIQKLRTPGMALPVVLIAGALTVGLFSVGLATAWTTSQGMLPSIRTVHRAIETSFSAETTI